MRIGILSRAQHSYATTRLATAARKRGHRVTLMDPFECALYLASGGPRVTHRGRSVERLDVLVPRLSSATAAYGLEVVAHFESSGVPSVNPSDAIATARHKWRTLRILADSGLPIPASFAAGDPDDLDRAIKRVGGYPFIAKPFHGTGGEGIMLFETPLTAKSALDTVWNLRQDYVGQRFYAQIESDLRVLVVGSRVLGGMERVAREGDFRSNMHRGAMGRAVAVPTEVADLAISAARAVQLGIAGVDMLRVSHGAVVLEVNPSPGFEGFEQVTHHDVADAMIRYAEGLCDPDAPGERP